jgi:hypothetical protein
MLDTRSYFILPMELKYWTVEVCTKSVPTLGTPEQCIGSHRALTRYTELGSVTKAIYALETQCPGIWW